MQNSTALPTLCVLSTQALIPHEDYDPRRAEKLSRRILEEGLLKNPPVVAAIPDSECYVVLDFRGQPGRSSRDAPERLHASAGSPCFGR
jgi:hypothetical protein